MEKPLRPQYGGGMILNPDLNDGLKGWSVSGGAKIEERVSGGGNRFIVAHSRSHKNDSVSQKLYMKKDKLYTFSGTFPLMLVPLRVLLPSGLRKFCLFNCSLDTS